jgi:phage N-6-adenine-methyltransferase
MMFLQNARNERSDTWLTPQWIIDKIGLSTLDPCGYCDGAFVRTAENYFSLDQGRDGLAEEWFGSVYVNPPYTQTDKWLKRAIEYFRATGNSVIFCLPCRTSNKWFQENVKHATGILFFDKRLHFLDSNGTDRGGAAFPACLVAYGMEAWERVKRVGGLAVLVERESL